jgi:hypothetical protein
MKNKWMFIAIAFIAICLSNEVNAQTPATNASVSGLVVDADSLYSMSGVNVFLLDANKKMVFKTVTNEKGLFAFVNVPKGAYQIRTAIQGYKVMISKKFEVAEGAQKYNYKLKIRNLEKGDIDIDMDYLEYLDLLEDRQELNDDK